MEMSKLYCELLDACNVDVAIRPSTTFWKLRHETPLEHQHDHFRKFITVD